MNLTPKSLLITSVFLYCAMVATLYFAQRKMLYLPTPPIDHGQAVEWLEHGDEKLEVIVLNPNKAQAILYFGGNAEAVSNNVASFETDLAQHTVYLLHYRGYGASSGSPSEPALFTDALALFDRVAPRHEKVSVMARSLGSGVGVYLATQRKLEKLLLVTPYDSITAVAKMRYPFFPVQYLLKDTFDSVSRAHRLEIETLVLLAENDQVIPRVRSEALIDELGNATVWQVPDSGHNTIADNTEYGNRIKSFFD